MENKSADFIVEKPINTIGKKVALVATAIFLIVNVLIVIASSVERPGTGMVGLLVAPFIWAMWIFCLVYFTILAMRFSREKSNMHQLDKIEFYILLLYFVVFFTLLMINNL